MKVPEILMYVLGGIIVIFFFLLLGMLFIFKVPQENRDILNIVIGAVVGAFVNIVGFFYGSSKGSKDKDDIINLKSDSTTSS